MLRHNLVSLTGLLPGSSTIKHWTIVLPFVLLAYGCNSALFQTARVQQGVSATMGVTNVNTGRNITASDYSIFVKTEFGKEGSPSRPGYAFGVTVITPVRSAVIPTSSTEPDLGSYPNQYAAFFPEFKFQFPQRLPFDAALDFRLLAYMPERICLILSKDIANASIYTSLGYAGAIKGLWVTGAKVALTQNLAFLLETSVWLSRHNYPEGVENCAPRPQSVGFAVSLSPSAKPKPVSPESAFNLESNQNGR